MGGQEGSGREVALPVTMGPHDCPLQPSHSRRLEVYMSLALGLGVPGNGPQWSEMRLLFEDTGITFSFRKCIHIYRPRAQVFSGHETHVLQH